VEPSVEPSETPGLSRPEWLDERDGYFYITGEVSVEELLKWEKPESVLIETPEGEPVISGNLATGMLARWSRDGTDTDMVEKRIIVWGDCDGNGKIDEKDMEQAQLILLRGKDSVEEWYFLAADHDESGGVTAQDLLWLSAELEKVD